MSANKMKDEKRYCKHCGGEIDPDTKICGTCGKQYFKGKNILKKAPVLVLTLLLCFSAVFNILTIKKYKEQSTTLKSELASAKTELDHSQSEVNELQSQLNALQSENETQNEEEEEEEEEEPISREGLADSGEFDTVSAFKTAVARNPSQFENTIVTVNLYIRRKAGILEFGISGVDKQNLETEPQKSFGLDGMKKYIPGSIIIEMRDDTKNRALTGDYVKLTGIYTGTKIIDATYEMIEAAD